MSEDKWKVIKVKFEQTLKSWELDKKTNQFTTDSICSLFPTEIEVIIKYIEELEEHYNNMFECHCNRVQVEQLQNNWNELKKWLEEVHNEENKYNFGTEDYAYNQVICYMQELEGNNE